MFRFGEPDYLYLLCLIPVLIGWKWIVIYIRRRQLRTIGEPLLVPRLMPGVSTIRPLVKFILLLMVYASLVVVLARPQFGMKLDTNKRKGIEVVFALDVSNSMLAQDVSPNRLERAKMFFSTVVDRMTDDKVGLVVFAGDAFVQLPITSDYVSAQMFMDALSPSMIRTQGTDIARALNLATNSFTQEKNIGRAVIIITDGEDHEGGVSDALKAAKAKGINVFVLGIGTTGGAPIPQGGGYLKDRDGNVVITRLNESMCKDIARQANGKYIHIDNSSLAQEQLEAELNQLTKKESTVSYSDYDEQFQAFALIALFLLFIEGITLERKNTWFNHIKLFKR